MQNRTSTTIGVTSALAAVVAAIAGLGWQPLTNSNTPSILSDEVQASDDSGDVRVSKMETQRDSAPPIELTGRWRIQSHLLHSTYNAYAGNLTKIYEVGITQTGDKLLIRGEKIGEVFRSEFRSHSGKARTRFDARGTLDSSKVIPVIDLDVIEGSLTRSHVESNYVIEVRDNNNLIGSFSSDAASSTGKSEWTRITD